MNIFKKFQIPHLSISQIKAFQRNPVFWYFSYILKLPQEETQALAYGKKIHSYIEHLLKNTRIPDLDLDMYLVAQDAADEVNHVCPCWELYEHGIEESFVYQFFEEYPPIKGIIDFWTIQNGEIYIIDHKTFKNAQWALKEHELAYDIQLAVYAAYIGRKTQSSICHVWHNQIDKSTDKVRAIGAYTHAACAELLLDNLLYEIKKMEGFLIDLDDWESLALNIHSKCNTCQYTYGKCPYRDICSGKITAQQYKKNTEEPMDFTEEKIVDLSPLMKKAKDFWSQNPNQNKFDIRESMCKSIMAGLEKYGINAVRIPQFLAVASDPDYTQTLTAIREAKIKIYVEII